MDSFELLAAIVFFFIGYWVIGALWPARKRDGSSPPGSGDAPAANSSATSDGKAHADVADQSAEPQVRNKN